MGMSNRAAIRVRGYALSIDLTPLYLPIEKNVRWKRLSALAGGHRPKRVAKSPDSPLATTVGEPWDLRHCHARPNSRWITIARTRQVTVMKFICGVDISKARFDACIEPGAIFASFDNDAAGIAELATFCRRHQAELVAMEATGGYERRAFLLLWEAGMPCALTNPRSVRRYAESMGILEKTDRIDARVIARFAHARNLQPTSPPTPAQQRLKALVARLRQVTDDLTVQKQRRASLLDNAEMLASLNEVIALLKRQSRRLEGEIASMIDDDPLWAQLAETWRSVKGVAGRTVARLMADLPEIGTYSNKAIAKLVGVAPIANDSGKRKGKRPVRGGRSSVRSILFLVAAIAARYDHSLGAFRDRLLAAGKHKMAVRIALAHKLLVRLNAKARDARAQYAYAT
jgi:transposase